MGGTDSYTNAISDIYQDNFGEGIFTGKGIYDVNVFYTCLNNEIPENTNIRYNSWQRFNKNSGTFKCSNINEDLYTTSNSSIGNKSFFEWYHIEPIKLTKEIGKKYNLTKKNLGE